jgi:hypothetical protein
MHIAQLLARGVPHRRGSSVLVRRRMRRRWQGTGVDAFGIAALLCAAGLALVVSGAVPRLSIPALLGRDVGRFPQGPIDEGPAPLLVQSRPSRALVVL